MRSRVRVPRRSRAAPARGAHALATDFPRRARFAKSRFSCRPHCTARAPLRRRHLCDDTRDELSRTRHPSTLTCATSSQFHSAARTTRAPRRRRACSTRPHSDARWRPRSHDPARSAIFHSLGVRTDGVPRNGHVREYVFGALRAAAAELTFDAERGGPKRVADERSAMVEKQRQHHL